jgi:hypothetical protein
LLLRPFPILNLEWTMGDVHTVNASFYGEKDCILFLIWDVER